MLIVKLSRQCKVRRSKSNKNCMQSLYNVHASKNHSTKLERNPQRKEATKSKCIMIMRIFNQAQIWKTAKQMAIFYKLQSQVSGFNKNRLQLLQPTTFSGEHSCRRATVICHFLIHSVFNLEKFQQIKTWQQAADGTKKQTESTNAASD